MADVRLIDANALIKHYSCVEEQKSSAEKIRAEIIVQALENAPTIDPKCLQPVGRDDREKLIKLIQSAVDGCAEYWAGLIADHLIANGVTFATDTNDGSKWVPVTEGRKESERMNKPNFCAFREYRGDICSWWCVWKNGACDRLTVCKNPPGGG